MNTGKYTNDTTVHSFVGLKILPASSMGGVYINIIGVLLFVHVHIKCRTFFIKLQLKLKIQTSTAFSVAYLRPHYQHGKYWSRIRIVNLFTVKGRLHVTFLAPFSHHLKMG